MPIVTVQFDTDTHKVVPLSQTYDMLQVGRIMMEKSQNSSYGVQAECVYQAMIAAAPDVQLVTLPDDAQKVCDWGSLIETLFTKTDILHEAQSPSDVIRKTVAWFQKHGIAACLSNSAKSERQTGLSVTDEGQGEAGA